MPTPKTCPECGAPWDDEGSCEQAFHQMLFWEAEDPARGVVHHLTVLCYHLQHPSLYSPEGLNGARQLLAGFVTDRLDPQLVRRREAGKLSSSQRSYKITARPGAQGAYTRPITWQTTALDVIAAGADQYIESVRAWAQSVYQTIKEEDNH